MGTTWLWLEESNITDDLIVMGTTRLWIEESNITDDLIAFVQQNSSIISRKSVEDTGVGIRALSCELNVSAPTMKLALNEDLRYYSCKRRRGQLLTEKACENHLTKGKKLPSKVKHPAEPQTICSFSMRKTSAKIKSTACSIIDGLQIVQGSLLVSCRLNFSKLLSFSDVSYEGDVMPPHFFREGLMLNSDAYVELLITVVKPWITRVANDRPNVWQQDSAPATPLGKVKNGCRRISTTTPVPMFCLLTPQILTPWIIMYGAL